MKNIELYFCWDYEQAKEVYGFWINIGNFYINDIAMQLEDVIERP